MRKKAKQAGGKRRGRPPLSSGNRQGDPGPEVFPESKAGEERNPQRAYNLRGTPARKRARSEVQISLQEPSSDLTPREDEWGEEQADEEILLPADSQDQPLPDEREGQPSRQQPSRGPTLLPGDVSSPSSSSSLTGLTRTPARVSGLSGELDNRHSPQTSPARPDHLDGSALDRLARVLERVGTNHRTSGMDDLQIKMLANYQPFDSARHDICAWIAGFKRLVPDDASNEQVMRALDCRLPHKYADLLRLARSQCVQYTWDWRETVRLFLSRVAGSENKLSKLRRLKTLTQDGEEIRQFAIRVRDELKKVGGREPRDPEWREGVMVGALDATAMELDRVANQMPEDTDFWDVIKAVEYWERQNAALLNQADPHSIRRSSAQGVAVLVGNVASPGKDPSIVCTWCSQRGHMEVECLREPRCAICFGDHPERTHDAAARRTLFPVGAKRNMQGESPGHKDRDNRNLRQHAQRDSGDRNQARPSRPPPPPARASARAAQDSAGWSPRRGKGSRDDNKARPDREVFQLRPRRPFEKKLPHSSTSRQRR